MRSKFKTPAGKYARQTLDLIDKKNVKGVPIWVINPLEHSHIDRIAGEPAGTYKKNPEPTYLKMLRNAGCAFVDQFIPDNPLTMGSGGYEKDSNVRDHATAGNKQIVMNGMVIDSPEAVAEHLEKFVFPGIELKIGKFDCEKRIETIIRDENTTQELLGDEILKVPYGNIRMPYLAYETYGYENFFMAYALFPEIMEKYFRLQADIAAVHNEAVARAYVEGGLPMLLRVDHDMAAQKGTLVDIQSLDRIWFPHFKRSMDPLVKAGITVIWHCDGYLMDMFPRLLECGLSGFQGFQYEYGMDYEKICAMKPKNGDRLFVIAGVSVTRTLPFGSPDDVKKEMKWLVEKGSKTRLTMACSSSIAPGVPWANMEALIEGFKYYRDH